jgi:hypothetical protein
MQPQSSADIILTLSRDLVTLASRCRAPARCVAEIDYRIDEAERIADGLWTAVRGKISHGSTLQRSA